MSRSTIANRRKVIFDKNHELRNYSLPSISSSVAESPIQLRVETQEFFKAIVHCVPYTGFTLDTSEWQIVIEVSTALAGTYGQIGVAKLPGTGGQVEVPLSGEYVTDILPGATFVRARSVRIGAPGNLTYGAFLSC